MTEGGSLSSLSGKVVVHPPPQDQSKPFFQPVGELEDNSDTTVVTNPLSFDAIEFGTLHDFLANDQYYAESFKYMRCGNSHLKIILHLSISIPTSIFIFITSISIPVYFSPPLHCVLLCHLLPLYIDACL